MTRERWYLRRKHDLRHQAKEQEIQACDYADALCELYSRITIIRVDFHYRSEAHGRLRVEHVFDDLDKLIAKQKRNPISDHLIGHIYSVEQGDKNDGGATTSILPISSMATWCRAMSTRPSSSASYGKTSRMVRATSTIATTTRRNTVTSVVSAAS